MNLESDGSSSRAAPQEQMDAAMGKFSLEMIDRRRKSAGKEIENQLIRGVHEG